MRKRRKIPTKAELLQLQKLYKTDEKIGERLGGVPAYLVAYWRRKKNIPKYSLPKFSETEIRNLWERYGDDEKSGLELGISKAAFYNWRRRYGIREKPAFLKLEQLELNFPGIRQPEHTSSLWGKRSVVQKVLARLADVERIEVGETIEVEPDLVICPGGAGTVVQQFKKQGAEFVFNPNKIIIMLDYAPTRNGKCPAAANKMIREFARRQSIKALYDLRDGVCQQLALEKGHIFPGHLVIGSGRRVSAYGCMAAFATAVEEDVMPEIWAKGNYRLTVPETIRIVAAGRRYRGVYAVDVALSIIKQFGVGGAEGRVIEYVGGVVSQMTIGERFALANLSSEMGAIASICTYDATTRRYLTGRTMSRYQPLLPDKDAEYHAQYQVNIDQLTPQIACQGRFDDIRPVAEVEGTPVQHVVLGSCTAGRFEDLRVAAEVLKGKHVHDDCRLMIVPGSRSVYLEALKKGLVRVFVEAGAMVMNPASCPGMLLSDRFLAAGERCLSTTNMYFTRRDNSNKSDVYLCSPATAAVSALNGTVTDPTRFVR